MIDPNTYVIVRSSKAGVHAGLLQSHDLETHSVHLIQSRRLWYWRCARGDFLSGVAAWGLHESSKVGAAVEIVVAAVTEVIVVTALAQQSIENQPVHGW